MKPHEIRRALFIGAVMFPVLIMAQYFGIDSLWVGALSAGVSSGCSVILFPNPDRKP